MPLVRLAPVNLSKLMSVEPAPTALNLILITVPVEV